MKMVSNSIHLIGNLGRNPEMKKLQSGKSLVNVSLATNDFYKDKNGEQQKRTQWHKLVAWDQRAEIMEKYLRKGSEIAVVGRLEYREYEDKDGVKRTIAEIRVEDFQMLGKKGGAEA